MAGSNRNGLNRRELGRLAAGAGLAGGALSSGVVRAAGAAGSMTRPFPDKFLWGCATASYQIEGGVHEGGRGPTIWDVFSHTPGKVANGDTGDVACDSYHRYPQDVALLKALGVSSYRMSIAWSRIFPDGRGKPNAAGLDYYKRVIDALHAAGIEPYVTLFHWDLPSRLPGEWQNRDTAYAYADYAGYTARALGDRVRHYMTVNELRCFTDLSHLQGIHAPGLKLGAKAVNQVRHHGVLAHGLGVQALRANAPSGTQVGIADNTVIYVPVMETPEHIAAARAATRAENAMFLTAIMEGRYLDSYLAGAGADAPVVKPGDMAAIGSKLDFLALNVYAPEWARASDNAKGYETIGHLPQSPHMASPWLYVGPEVAYWAVRHASELWHPSTIYISENGSSADDQMINGRVDDVDRVMYLRNYLGQFHRAIDDGFPLKGYFLWSLMDNFEWADGYTKRFGIHYTDFATQQRIPKLSAKWYSEVIRRNALV
ncbi:GH1 family beta-glucosidase [Sphingomonas sp. ASV193]|uniref:GH1 family beta-glucosidase n=1 Tax=Sphingomonas sp. ASV193 TaxID=3144405 RepID=UPI0032E8C268